MSIIHPSASDPTKLERNDPAPAPRQTVKLGGCHGGRRPFVHGRGFLCRQLRRTLCY